MNLKYHSASNKFVDLLNQSLEKTCDISISQKQRGFLSFIISAMVLTGSLNFLAFERLSFSYYSNTALSWMLHRSPIPWSNLMFASVYQIFVAYSIFNFHLVIDDTDRPRSKVVKVLWGVFKTFNKLSGGWMLAQNVVFICVVSNKVCIPIGFRLYRPDPKYVAWQNNDRKLRKKKVPKKSRPKPPKVRDKFPTRIGLAMNMLKRFLTTKSKLENALGRNLQVKSISFDAAFMSNKMNKFCKTLYPETQVISQIASNQIVWDKGKHRKSVSKYFSKKSPVIAELNLRGKKTKVFYLSARLTVKSHKEVLHVVALRYEGEEKYRYMVANQLTWRTEDIIKAYSFRWLIEVVNFDWKQNSGFGKMAFQRGADGTCRGMILSLLADHFLLTHSLQLRQSHADKPLWTAGSIVRRLQCENTIETIERIFESENPKKSLEEYSKNLREYVNMLPSRKHMCGIENENILPSESLKLRYSR